MKKIILSEEEFNKLEPLNLPSGIRHTEANLFLMPGNNKEIIKAYTSFYDKKYMEIKFKAIKNLLKFVREEKISELLLPTNLLYTENVFRGIVYPKISGFNSSIYLNSKFTPIKTKIEILKSIGLLLEKIKNANPKFNASFADVHADNFIISGISSNDLTNTSNMSLTACDTESMKILDSPGITNFYLYKNANLDSFDKYEANVFGMIKPNTNTDIYCFIMMILEVISRSNLVYTLTIDEYKRYLDYLDKLGFDNRLLTSLASVYDDSIANINPLPFLDDLTKANDNSTMLSFYKNKERKIL